VTTIVAKTRLATIVLATMLVSATILTLAGAMIYYVGNLPASSMTAVDGDTLAVQGEPKLFRLVGLDAPESGNRAQCDAERILARRPKGGCRNWSARAVCGCARFPAPARRARSGRNNATTGVSVPGSPLMALTWPKS
jgi:hypothetical protein